MASITIRPARRGDLDEIMRLYRQLMLFHADLDARLALDLDGIESFRGYVENVLHSEFDRVLVAEDEGPGLAGFIMGRVAQNPPMFQQPYFGYVTDICVDEKHRQQGIGRALFQSLRQWFSQQGLITMQVNVAARNPTSQAFWRAMGFADLLTRLWQPVGE
ncbi:MAG: GNAT family N-acetyltransferase [Chloroflexi bacterium]|nr:GNAT family N-acetyltransferase [Chloroflexota bacterium]MBU1750620.1 GNAT family N-acetyltransferase [Chloroflexota bacterium]MBU1880331.1 GNAT family N-acetyltransferase [Chloroflexota bacterium]